MPVPLPYLSSNRNVGTLFEKNCISENPAEVLSRFLADDYRA
jgi:hypothetical protein